MMVVHNPAFQTSLLPVSKGFTVSSSRLGRARDEETETAFGAVHDGGGHDEAVVRKTCPSRLLTYAAFSSSLYASILFQFRALAVPASLSSPDNADPLCLTFSSWAPCPFTPTSSLYVGVIALPPTQRCWRQIQNKNCQGQMGAVVSGPSLASFSS